MSVTFRVAWLTRGPFNHLATAVVTVEDADSVDHALSTLHDMIPRVHSVAVIGSQDRR